MDELSVEICIKSVGYYVNVGVVGEERLSVQLEDVESAETWRASFEANYIEDLTKRTGNFKSFPVFANMLQAALRQESGTVSLDLLTYNDLEMLRLKKTNSLDSSLRHNNTTNNNNSNHTNNNKRYLILTYNVEFDRINYPLQLNYQGKPEAASLLKIIRRHKMGLSPLVESSFVTNDKEIERVQKENEKLKKANEALQLEAEKRASDEPLEVTRREIKTLKQMIKSIEESSSKEKCSLQKQIVKKNREIEALKRELDEARITERNLHNQLKSLTASKLLSQRAGAQQSQRNRSASRDSLSSSSRGLIRERSVSADRLIDRMACSRKSSASPCDSISSACSRGRSPSLSKRFNPTEYVREKNRKIEESGLGSRRDVRGRVRSKGASTERSSNRIRTQSANSDQSFDETLSISSKTSSYRGRKTRPNSTHRRGQTDRTSIISKLSHVQNGPVIEKRRVRQEMSVKSQSAISFDRAQEMQEIDAKLKSLELLIKNAI